MKLTDDMLREAAKEEEQFLLLRYPLQPSIVHLFSKKFQHKMRVLIRQERRSPFVKMILIKTQRIAVVLLVALTVATTTIMSIDALRTKFFNMIQQFYQKYSTILYQPIDSQEKETDKPSGQPFIEYELAYLPEGFRITRERLSSTSKSVFYENEYGDSITYLQISIEQAEFDIDTEKANIERIKINNETAYYLPNPTLKTVFWSDHNYAFEISSNLDKNELLKIAESTKLKI